MIYRPWVWRMLPRMGTLRYLSGIYASYADAMARCGGYSDPTILQKWLAAAREVHARRAVWERDAVILPQVEFSWPILAELLRLQAENGSLTVLDFGGGLGSSYLQFKEFSSKPASLKWLIIEQEHIAEAGQREFATTELQFVSAIPSALTCRSTVALLSSVLQYLPDADTVTGAIKRLAPESIVIDRTPIGPEGFYTVQRVPASIYAASYPLRVFSRIEFDSLFCDWKLVADFPSYCDRPKALFRGRIYRRCA